VGNVGHVGKGLRCIVRSVMKKWDGAVEIVLERGRITFIHTSIWNANILK
jgi:hypothetical protein